MKFSFEFIKLSLESIIKEVLGYLPNYDHNYVESGDMDSLHIIEFLTRIEEIFEIDLLDFQIEVDEISTLAETLKTVCGVINGK